MVVVFTTMGVIGSTQDDVYRWIRLGFHVLTNITHIYVYFWTFSPSPLIYKIDYNLKNRSTPPLPPRTAMDVAYTSTSNFKLSF